MYQRASGVTTQSSGRPPATRACAADFGRWMAVNPTGILMRGSFGRGIGKIFFALVEAALSSCSTQAVAPATSSPVHPALHVGEFYGAARARLVAAGWQPLPNCNKGFVCFGPDYPELATNLSTGANCGSFSKTVERVTICTQVEPDAIFVKTFSFHR